MSVVFTLDDTHSLDLDDALEVERVDDQHAKIKVFIADVAGAVPKGHKFDEYAHQVVETRYWNGGNTPMLPRFMAENRLSLLPFKKRTTLCVRAVINRGLELTEPVRITKKAVVSKHKLAYAEIPGILADKTHQLHGVVSFVEPIAQALLEKRRKAGALAFYDLNEGWATTEEGVLLRLERAKANVGYIIVQEMMILANRLVAAWCAENGVPVLFRNHTAKSIAPDRTELLRQLDDARLHPETVEALRERVHLVMNRAEYSPTLVGHYGLNLPAYLHFTSPIRRYADLVTHRQIRAKIEGVELPYTPEELVTEAAHINAKIRENRDRKSDEMKENADKRGERRANTLDARRLANLKPADFERVLKVTLRGAEPNPDVIEAIRLRAKEGTLAVLDLFLILSTSPQDEAAWAILREEIVSHLVEHPFHGASIASMGMNVLGWSPLDYQHRKFGPDHALRFEAVARVTTPSGEVASPPVVATSLKLAKQQATISLLAVLADTKLPEWPAIETPPEPEKPLQVLQTDGGNPVNALQEIAQAHKLAFPTYSDKRVGGPDHAPTFAVTCTFKGIERTSQPSGNKKEAKKEAARLVMEALR